VFFIGMGLKEASEGAWMSSDKLQGMPTNTFVGMPCLVEDYIGISLSRKTVQAFLKINPSDPAGKGISD